MPKSQKELYQKYHASPKAIADRTKRVLARREMEKQGKVHKGDGKEVHHVKALSKGGSNDDGNLRVTTRRWNRSKRPY